MCKGYVKLHRSIKDWEWYEDANATRLLIHLLVSVNFTDKQWKGKTVKAGTLIFSWNTLSNELGMSVQQLRTAMTRLETSKEVTRLATSKYQVVTLCKWGKLQVKDTKPTRKTTIKQQSNNNQTTTTKEGKESKEGKEVVMYREFAHLSLSMSDYNNLLTKWTKIQIDKVLDSIENYTKNKNYKSLYLTSKNWLERDYPTLSKEDRPKTKQEIYEEQLREVLKNKKQ